MLKFLLLCPLLLVTPSQAADISSELRIETRELPGPNQPPETFMAPHTNIGEIIGYAERIVALGEKIYELVQKGKPNVNTSYAPIQVIPVIPGTRNPVDPMDIENAGAYRQRRFQTSVKNKMNVEIIRFEYMVIFSPGGSYEGKGKYIQNATIVPTSARALYGWDFNADMKLVGIKNSGTRADPVASALLSINYKAKSVLDNAEDTQVIEVTGTGQIIVH